MSKYGLRIAPTRNTMKDAFPKMLKYRQVRKFNIFCARHYVILFPSLPFDPLIHPGLCDYTAVARFSQAFAETPFECARA